MLIVGLTGGIASGKSTVAKMFEEKSAVVFDADVIAREVVSVGEPAWEEIVHHFGTGILLKDRDIDRKKLGDIVFSDASARNKLNSIVHPRVMEKLIEDTNALKKQNSKAEVVVFDVPLLIETGMHSLVDVVVLVYTPINIQKTRLKNRDGFSDREIGERLSSQMAIEEKKQYVDFTIDNSGSLDETFKQVEEFWGIVPLLLGKKKTYSAEIKNNNHGKAGK
ncbi:MAG: dephospho-CoA kinase [Dethiobacteria bacterium]